MAYLKPPLFVRKIFNKLAMKFGIGGAVTLAVTGRKTGARQTIPVIPVEVNGIRYLVSTRGESEWVRNVRASGTVELIIRGRSQTLSAVEIPVEERPAVIEAYKKVAGQVVDPYFKALPDPADHPTFRIG